MTDSTLSSASSDPTSSRLTPAERTTVATAIRRGVPPDRVATLTAILHEAQRHPDLFLQLTLTDPAGRPIVQADIHRELQTFLSNHRRALVELPRDHGKTTQVCGRIVWELGRNPALRIRLVCATETLAAERSRYLRSLIESERVRTIFPHLTPAGPWTAHAFTVARPADVVGPSVAAFGLGTGSTGSRADLLVCDDVVDVRALHSKAERDRAAEYVTNNLLNLLEPDGRFWGLCTPWHPDDLNARLKRNPSFAVLCRPVGPELEPVWPERWPGAALAERLAEIGPSAFARGYRLLPMTEGELAIRPEWVRFWTDELPREAYETVVLAVDPAATAGPSADASALVVLGLLTPSCSSSRSPLGSTEVRCLEAAARRLTAPDLVEAIADADARWRPDVILFETNAGFAAVRDLLVRRAAFGPKVTGVTQTRGKHARVAAFAVVVRNGGFRLKGLTAEEAAASQRALYEEMTSFPFGDHDDLLDAAATGTAHLLTRPQPRIWV
jgi:hypothetical protein